MRDFIQQQIRELDRWLADTPPEETDSVLVGDVCQRLLITVEREALRHGIPEAVAACQVGHADIRRTRQILAECLAACPEPEPEYLTVDQAAIRLQVSRDSIYDLINNGLLKHTKVGRVIRIRPADLDHIQADQDDGW